MASKGARDPAVMAAATAARGTHGSSPRLTPAPYATARPYYSYKYI